MEQNKKLSDVYQTLKELLEFHNKDQYDPYHSAEADDIQFCLNWLEVKHGVRTL